MKHLFLRARLKAIWNLLTKRYFVCITASDNGDAQGRYNVNHQSFRLLVRVIDPLYEENEVGGSLVNEANELLKPKN
jgi:hypothetical protein